MRVKWFSKGLRECSRLFDPVGPESADDGAAVQQVTWMKARVEDRGNLAPGQTVEHPALIDASRVTLYASPVMNGPLAVDTDGDGVCDEVNPLLVPTTNVSASNQALALALAPLGFGGRPDMRAEAIPLVSGCDEMGDPSEVQPPPACVGSALTYSLTYTTAAEPAIWSLPAVTKTQCAGLELDTLNRLPEGPTCVVVRAADTVGNVNVSAPLRVCIDRGGGKCAAWPPISLPSCTGSYDRKSMTTNATACVSAHFPNSDEIRQINPL
jgi:hypothetical protein